MNLIFDVPLRLDTDGVVRVGKTRIPVDIVIAHYHQGETPERIVEMFDVLQLVDVYGAIAYYLANKVEMDAYLEQRRLEGDRIRRQNEAHFDNADLHARLLAQLEEKKRQER